MKYKFAWYITAVCVLFCTLVFTAGCRTDEEAKAKIETIQFGVNVVNMAIGEEISVIVTALPLDGSKNEQIEYLESRTGIVEIKQKSNNGFVLKGLSYGSIVIMARAAQVTGYLEVRVEGGDYAAVPYIMVGTPVIELNEGEKRNMQVSLYGGSVLDNYDFTWSLEEGKDHIRIDTTANTVVIHGDKRGHQKIKVNHPKSEYQGEILVFVKAVNEQPKYITSEKNVVMMEAGGQYQHIIVSLYGGVQADKFNFLYEVVEGNGIIDIVANNEVLNVRANGAGSALIRVSHPLAEIDFDIRIIAVQGNTPVIILDKTFILMEIGDNALVEAMVENPKTSLADDEFTFEVAGQASAIQVTKASNQFFIQGIEGGIARIIVSNNQADYNREILVVVRTEFSYRDDYYITTSQNIIQTQVGDPDSYLSMFLIGGNESDANGFSWVVSDGSIIEVETGHKKENGLTYLTRKQVDNVFNAVAVITPKRPGVATITVSHSKSEVSSTVLVKVYPKYTFSGKPVLVRTEGLLKVSLDNNPPILPVALEMVQGDENDIGDVDWSIADTGIAMVNTDMHGKTNIITGIASGQTRLKVENGNLFNPHEAIVLAGTNAEIASASLIYVDSIYQNVVAGQAVNVQVKDAQNQWEDSLNYKVKVENPNLLYAVMVKSRLVLQGKSPGETTVLVEHPGSMNDVTLHVKVESGTLSIDKPYYIDGPEIVGIVAGSANAKDINVRLVGANTPDKGRLVWSVDDNTVVSIIANGESAIVTGKAKYTAGNLYTVPPVIPQFIPSQTNIRVSHTKSENEKSILVYVVENENDLDKIAIGVEKKNYLLAVGDEGVLVRLLTNANDAEKRRIEWSNSNASVVWVDSYYDSAMIRPTGTGNAEIVVSHPENIAPVSIFVSVIAEKTGEKYITGLPTIEMLTGTSKIVSLNTANLSSLEISNITWAVENNAPLASIQGNGDSAYLTALQKGVGYINVEQTSLGFRQRVTLLVADTQAELDAMYIMGVDFSFHKMMIGEEKVINLQFGSNGFPELAKSQIAWAVGNNGVVRAVGNGASATIIAVEEGRGTVTIASEASANKTLEIIFEVYGNTPAGNRYDFKGHEKTKGILVGNTDSVTMHMYNGSTEVTTGYSLLEYDNTDDTVVKIDPVDNVVAIRALKAGQSFITVDHPLANERARILVYAAETQAELDNFYPIAAEKTNYLIPIGFGGAVEIRLITEEAKDTPQNLEKITWGVQNSSVIEPLQFTGKKIARVQGKYSGDCVINISYNGTVREKIYISVVDNANVDLTKRINTENIIGLVRGTNKVTSIVTNLGSEEENRIIWEKWNSGQQYVSVNGTGRSATITAAANAPANYETYITVSYSSWLKRQILVYVAEDEASLKAYKAMNMENQYHRMGRNQTVVLPVYYAPNKPSGNTVWADKYGNDVVEFNVLENGAKIEVTGKNEGVAVLQAVNTGRSNNSTPMEIYFEISNEYINPPPVEELRYLTISKTVYVMHPDVQEPLELQITGIGMSPHEMQNLDWSVNNLNVSIFPGQNSLKGDKCRVLPNAVGESIVRVSYPGLNVLEIKIIVSRDGVVEDVPHIVFDDVIRVGLNQEKNVMLSIAGLSNYDFNNFTITCDNDNITVKRTVNIVTIEGKKTGQTGITISHNELPLETAVHKSVVLVTADPSGLIYLTTSDNFNVVKLNEYKTIKVDLVGYDEQNNSNFGWKVAEGHEDVVRVIGNGKYAQIQGLKEGTARIDVFHVPGFALFPVSIYVRVTDVKVNNTYITTSQNIVSVIQGNSMNLGVSLVNGSPGDLMDFRWFNLTPDVITLVGVGESGLVQGKNVGIGRVQIQHPFSLNSIEIVVIVEKDNTSSGIYITTDDMLIEMTPSDYSRRVNVRLVGGNMEDVYGFKWEIANYNSIDRWADGSSKPVIDITAGADSAYVMAKNEGEAVIRVTHPKTSYRLEIRVDVKYSSKIVFSKKELVFDMGTTQSVEVASPTGSKVIYESSNPSVVQVTGTGKICILEGLSDGVAVVTARNPAGTLSDELLVRVNWVNNVKIRYIETHTNLITLNTNQEPGRVSAKLVGKKDDGSDFTDLDYEYLRWEITEKEREYVSLFPNTGKEINITAVKPGNVELHLRHKDMPSGYVKRIYIQVLADEVTFRLDKNILVMQPLDTDVIECFLTNTPNSDYELLVEWDNTNPAVADMEIIEGSKIVFVRAKIPGSTQIRAKYNDVTIRTCTINVTEPKSLNVVSIVDLLPDQSVLLEYEVSPEGSDVTFSQDYYNYVDVKHDKQGCTLTLTGKGHDGITTITLSANGIHRTILVNTSHNFLFKAVGQASIRGRPHRGTVNGIQGGDYYFHYDIVPKGDNVYLSDESNYELRANGMLNVPYIDTENNTIVIQPLKAGAMTLMFESEYYRNTPNMWLKVPVYLYYDRIDLGFTVNQNNTNLLYGNGTGTKYSRVDKGQNALYLADGESIQISLDIDEGKYPNHGVKITGAKLKGIGDNAKLTALGLDGKLQNGQNNAVITAGGNELTEGNGIINNTVRLRSGATKQKSSFSYEVKLGAAFAGILEINYEYYNGGTVPAQFSKTYLLYMERYGRL